MKRVLGRGPWLSKRPGIGTPSWYLAWEEFENSEVRRRSRGVGKHRSRKDAWKAADKVFEDLCIVLPPAPERQASARRYKGMPKGRVGDPQARRLRADATARWQREQALGEAAMQAAALALALAEDSKSPAQEQPEAALIEGLPEGAYLVVVLPDGRRIERGERPPAAAPELSARDRKVAEQQVRRERQEQEDREQRVKAQPVCWTQLRRRPWSVHGWLNSRELDEYLLRDYPRSYRRRVSQLRALVATLPDVPLKELTPGEIEGYKTHRRYYGKGGEGCAATTVRIELETLRVALRLAHELKLVDELIHWRMPRWKQGRRSRAAWTVAEYTRVLSTASPPRQRGITRGHPPLPFSRDIRLQILLGVDAILRPGEIHHCAWRDIDLEAERPQLHVVSKPEVDWYVKGEHGEGHEARDRWVPLSPKLAQALRERWLADGRPRSGWLFPGRVDPSKPITTFRGALARVCLHASVRVLRPVELRHTGATIAAQELGFGPDDLMAVGGWASPQIPYSVYVKRATGPAARKMEQYAAKQAEAKSSRRHSIDVARWKPLHRGRGGEKE